MQAVTDKRRIPHDVVQLLRRDDLLPVQPQGVTFDDIGVRLQRQEVARRADDAFRGVHHLALGDPQRRLGDGHGEVVDLDAVELADAHLDVGQQHPFAFVVGDEAAEQVVLDLAQAQEGFREEVPAAGGGVEEAQRGEFVLELGERRAAVFAQLDLAEFCVFALEFVEEQRGDDLVDVLDAGVVHPAGAARFGVQGALEDGAEDGGADLAPVELVAAVVEDEADDLLVERRHFLRPAVAEQAAVDVGKCGRGGFVKGIAFRFRRVKHGEQLDEGVADVGGLESGEVVVAYALGAEHAGVLGVEAEDEAHTELVEVGADLGGQFLGIAAGKDVGVLLFEGVVEFADEFAGLDGKFQLFFQVRFLAALGDEREAVIILFQIGQSDLRRFGERALHVVDQEGLKVAGDDVTRVQIEGKIRDVLFRLLEGRKDRSVALFDAFAQVLVAALLLDHHARGGDVRVDEVHVLIEHGVLELDELLGLFHAENAAQ